MSDDGGCGSLEICRGARPCLLSSRRDSAFPAATNLPPTSGLAVILSQPLEIDAERENLLTDQPINQVIGCTDSR
jgi:hypothetical protein